ncbi:FadR/GntR family transcriptional regulator, partial [Klebsiella pneumoniae]|uniref:FadR/GntR family transcriptional regulator n=1 Tax=Klebsiella pneumoniae TaxID=573 RepID=UPI00195353B3
MMGLLIKSSDDLMSVSMQPATRTNLTDSATENLRAEIVGGRWPVGDRIPNEAALSEQLSVSRGT